MMGVKRRIKMKGGVGRRRGCSRHIGGGTEALDFIQGGSGANPSKYLLLSIRGKVGADKNGGDGGSANGSRGSRSGSVSVQPPHCVTLIPVNGFHSFSHPAAWQTLSMH